MVPEVLVLRDCWRPGDLVQLPGFWGFRVVPGGSGWFRCGGSVCSRMGRPSGLELDRCSLL